MAFANKCVFTMLPLTPTRLGRYEIVDEIGKGAMGVVYLARDPLIGRLVALKTFRIGYSVKDQEMEQFRQRFMREAQSAGILTHPNIVTIHDVVESSDDGVAFIAMEYVRGTNLKLLLQGDQPLSMQFIIDTIAQIGDALDYAHSNRVIHRDVKPANILITSDNRVKITDFGIARLDSSNLTQEGQLLGTPNYMAPEQIQGREVDHRADLFSLGVVLYEMLTRHKPFQGENLTVVSHRIVYDHFTPPREYVRSLAPGIDKVLSRALEKDPARRYQRAREMADDLRKAVGVNALQDELNETQSLSATMVLPPSLSQVPPLPPPPSPPAAAAPAAQPSAEAKPSLFSRWRKPAAPAPVAAPPPAPDPGTGTGSLPPVPALAAVPPLPESPSDLTPDDTVVTPLDASPMVPPPPKAPAGSGLSLRWLFVGVGTAALVVLFGGALILLLRGWSKPAPTPPPAPAPVVVAPAATPEGRKAQVAKLIADGNAAMRRGDWAAAIASYQQAEQIDPNGEARQFREAAERQAQEFQSTLTREQAIAKNIAGAKQALKTRKYNQAVQLATLALNLDPKNEEAAALLAQAERRAKQRSPATEPTPGAGEQIAGTTPIPSEAQPTAEPSPAETRSSSVRVHFQSEGDASLIVWVDGRRVINQNFGGRGGGLFGRKNNQEGYEHTETIDVPAGAKVALHVTPKGKKAIVKQFEARGGSQRLEVYLSKDQQLTAQLN
jgi:serine/threonine protein kinase